MSGKLADFLLVLPSSGHRPVDLSEAGQKRPSSRRIAQNEHDRAKKCGPRKASRGISVASAKNGKDKAVIMR